MQQAGWTSSLGRIEEGGIALMGLRRDVKRATRVHLKTCSTCRASGGNYAMLCQEFFVWSSTLGEHRKNLREMARISS
jgi:hypothetical protein